MRLARLGEGGGVNATIIAKLYKITTSTFHTKLLCIMKLSNSKIIIKVGKIIL